MFGGLRYSIRDRAVGLRIGEPAGVDPESLRFGFEALVKDSDLQPLELEVECVARSQRCAGIIGVSAQTGAGLAEWLTWLSARIASRSSSARG